MYPYLIYGGICEWGSGKSDLFVSSVEDGVEPLKEMISINEVEALSCRRTQLRWMLVTNKRKGREKGSVRQQL